MENFKMPGSVVIYNIDNIYIYFFFSEKVFILIEPTFSDQ